MHKALIMAANKKGFESFKAFFDLNNEKHCLKFSVKF